MAEPLTLSLVEGSSGDGSRLGDPSLPPGPTNDSHVIPRPREGSGAGIFPSPQCRIRGRRMCMVHASASILLSPSPGKALRERGTKGVRVPLLGVGSILGRQGDFSSTQKSKDPAA